MKNYLIFVYNFLLGNSLNNINHSASLGYTVLNYYINIITELSIFPTSTRHHILCYKRYVVPLYLGLIYGVISRFCLD